MCVRVCVCVCAGRRPHLVLLLEAVAVGGLHQVDVLQQVGHTDGWVELPCLVGGLGALAVVPGDVQQATGLC